MRNKIVLILLICFLSNASANEKYLILADDGYPPYSFAQKNSIVDGLYFKILSKIFSKMKNFDTTIEAIPWKRGLEEVKDEKAFAIYPAYFRPNDPERNWMDYSDNIYKEKVVIYCNKKILGKGKWPEDFRGLSIGTTHLGILKKSSHKYPRSKEFIKEFNKELSRLKTSGSFEKIVRNYIKNYK
ncbi:transporter substrate-binding domain-containing protein [Fluviispira vulneris]|uniref:transporter substrate-binding domain-containing protein n=1 Tax=Fluviispira vulneris TaxID=2763012 RepID=UPI001646ACB2|nr:hypothetical protein [Fluviispira vulneris]